MACRVCGAAWTAAAFYRSITTHCKECWKAQSRAYRAKNIERIREYDRQRGQLPERKDANAIRQRAMSIEYHRARFKKWQTQYPERRAAHITAGNAIRDGRLIPQPCERCGEKNHTHAHHEDYSKPLDVMWLCRPCHGKRHREINAERRQAEAA